MGTYLNVKRRGYVADFSRVSNYDYCWAIPFDYDPLDGATWTGSVDNLMNFERFKYCQRFAPKIKFDFGTWCGYDDFDYIFIYARSWGGYYVYALTHNNTILQPVGWIIVGNYYSENPSFYVELHTTPDENYIPEDPGTVASITVDGTVYVYSERLSDYTQKWVNEQDSTQWMNSEYLRNPSTGGLVHDNQGNSWYIDSVEERGYVETITVDGVVYRYSEPGPNRYHIWVNDENNEMWVDSNGNRNPEPGNTAYILGETSSTISEVTYYDWVTLP